MNGSSGSDGAYLCSDKGILLPFLDESKWNVGVRAVLYLSGLLYSFLGVAIAADVFMCSIERITSKTKRIPISDAELMETTAINKSPDDGEFIEKIDGAESANEQEDAESESGTRYREVLVWNPTVANLTLMALGSSAPEILLSIIEICGKNFQAGELGPGTIVGSAAFNLLGITAVCMFFLPEGEKRRIEQIWVFMTTSIFSIFAYIWLLIVLLGFSPNVVEVWEGLFTFLFFIILVLVAYMVDRRFCWKWLATSRAAPPGGRTGETVHIDEAMERLKDGQLSQLPERCGMSKERLTSFRNKLWLSVQKKVEQEHPNASLENIARIVAEEVRLMEPRNRLHYRIMATRWMSAMQPKLEKEFMNMEQKAGSKLTSRQVSRTASTTLSTTNLGSAGSSGTLLGPYGRRMCVIEFSARIYAFTKKDSFVKVKLLRKGRVQKRIFVRYETINGSAKKNEHFLPKAETVIFAAGESEKTIIVDLIPTAKWEDDQGFFIKLALEGAADRVQIGSCHPAIIRYTEGEGTPQIQFQRHNYSCKESECVVRLPVVRSGQSNVPIVVKYDTKDIEAQEGKDYIGGPGELTFEPGEMVKFLDLQIIDDKDEEKAETFLVFLTEATGGAAIGTRASAVVTIISDENVGEMVRQMHYLVPLFLKGLEPGTRSWKEQIVIAASVNGGDTAEATMGDVITHIIAFPWKVIFSMIPPPMFFGGWLSFVLSLMMIGLLTAIVGDLASIFGCLVGLKDAVTAITLVAAGTSLPDLFASRLAATSEDTADNAIGNVTGSNSVNVFLGLGLPWLIASIYHEARGGRFEVPSGDLGFSVVIFTMCALFCFVLLALRRQLTVFGKAELGGPTLMKGLSAAFLGFLWLLYVLLSTLQTYGYISSF